MPNSPCVPKALEYWSLFLLVAGVGLLIQRFVQRDMRRDVGLPAWSISGLDFSLYFWIFAMIFFLLPSIIAGLIPEEVGAIRTIAMFLGTQLTILALALNLYKRLGSFNQCRYTSSKILRHSLICFVASVPLTTLGVYGWGEFLKALEVEIQPQSLVQLLQGSSEPAIFALIGFGAIVLAPLSEEIMLRGLLYRYLRMRIHPQWAAVATGLLFGLIHYDLVAFFPLSLLGYLLARAYEETGHLAVPILFHSLFNAHSFAMILITQAPTT